MNLKWNNKLTLHHWAHIRHICMAIWTSKCSFRLCKRIHNCCPQSLADRSMHNRLRCLCKFRCWCKDSRDTRKRSLSSFLRKNSKSLITKCKNQTEMKKRFLTFFTRLAEIARIAVAFERGIVFNANSVQTRTGQAGSCSLLAISAFIAVSKHLWAKMD